VIGGGENTRDRIVFYPFQHIDEKNSKASKKGSDPSKKTKANQSRPTQGKAP